MPDNNRPPERGRHGALFGICTLPISILKASPWLIPWCSFKWFLYQSSDGSCTNHLLTGRLREMQQDVVMLVALNKKREYDLAQDLKPQNVLVCIGTGRIKVRDVSGDLVTIKSEFKAYSAAGALFHRILWTLYHGSRLLSHCPILTTTNYYSTSTNRQTTNTQQHTNTNRPE